MFRGHGGQGKNFRHFGESTPGGFHPVNPMGMRHLRAGFPPDFMGSGLDSAKRFLRPAVMLLLAEKPAHGYELMTRLKELGIGRGMDPSLLYRLLRMLERAGLTESSLDDSGAGPARKVYRLTPQGEELLDMWMSGLDDVFELLQQLKERYQKLRKEGD